ncbi:protein associated with UVRAG as autophagy enhancer [Notolabrus celidotus]|uniref:protein associated with UVRAG as autophagy enhancer n=1 Tax=Notolabrus celidotus TaxID=1203425 RepID=UPI00148F49E1|nr:protein associated with UVRAG as autophagy enhancer [Notolabrus celidotus]XP_034549127.1 protein associated with UVRAG as autophagy enhancer [Notolabrus celidotus]
MDRCRRDSSTPLRRDRYISWCVDPDETPTLAATDEPLPASPGSVPHILLSPSETRGRAHPPQQPTLTKRSHKEAFTLSNRSRLDSESLSDDEGRKGDKDRPAPQHQEDECVFLLHRSSAVIRRHRPVSWHQGGTDSSDLSSPDSPSPVPGFLALDQRKHLTGKSMEDVARRTGSRLSTSEDIRREKRRSGIPEFSADIFKTACELEQENAHFIVVDMVLEILEGVKWTLLKDTHKHTHCQSCTQQDTSSAEEEPSQRRNHRSNAPEHHEERHSDDDVQTSFTHTHSSCTREDKEEAGKDEDDHQPKIFSVLSSDSGFEDCGVDLTQTPRESLRNAEVLAQKLVQEFRRSWLPSDGPRRGRLSLRSSLQQLPGTTAVSVSSSGLKEEIRLRTRMRGSLSWAPPEVQIIFDVQPNQRRGDVIAQQNFLCAGCGTEFEHKHVKKLRYCEYLGRYFCACCHSGSEAVIPARVLTCWDFNRFPVSDFSKQLLDSIWFQPVFDLTCVGTTLYSRVKELHRFRELQDQLQGIKKLLKACRFSGQVMAEFEVLPAHLTEQPHLFSLDDLLRVKKGQLVAHARVMLSSSISHVENCVLCLARGFICEFCREKDVIFPFQTDICKRCPVCRTCFHKHCYVEKECLKCARIKSRKKRPTKTDG